VEELPVPAFGKGGVDNGSGSGHCAGGGGEGGLGDKEGGLLVSAFGLECACADFGSTEGWCNATDWICGVLMVLHQFSWVVRSYYLCDKRGIRSKFSHSPPCPHTLSPFPLASLVELQELKARIENILSVFILQALDFSCIRRLQILVVGHCPYPFPVLGKIPILTYHVEYFFC